MGFGWPDRLHGLGDRSLDWNYTCSLRVQGKRAHMGFRGLGGALRVVLFYGLLVPKKAQKFYNIEYLDPSNRAYNFDGRVSTHGMNLQNAPIGLEPF